MIIQSHPPVGGSRGGVREGDDMRTTVESVIERAYALALMKESGL